jgi:predicted Zn-dependent peptidase
MFNHEVQRVVERMGVTQAKLVIGYRTPITGLTPGFYPALLFSTILGGTPSSRLFNRLREQESLCYYVQSKLDKFKGLLIITAGIDKAVDVRATDLIDEVFKDLINGNVAEEELQIAKKAVISGLRSITDYPNSFSNFLFSQWVTQEQPDIDQLVKKLEDVTLAQVIEAGKSFEKDTWYLLTGEESQ